MEKPDDVAAMLRLQQAGWGVKRIAAELGCARNTVRRYIREGGWKPYAGGSRAKLLDEHLPWVLAAFEQHGGNAEVVRQELCRLHGVEVSLRTIERAVRERRKRLRAEVVATVRFETPPGDPVVAAAILDRLLHHSTIVAIRGDSYRLREKRRSGLVKGVSDGPSQS